MSNKKRKGPIHPSTYQMQGDLSTHIHKPNLTTPPLNLFKFMMMDEADTRRTAMAQAKAEQAKRRAKQSKGVVRES